MKKPMMIIAVLLCVCLLFSNVAELLPAKAVTVAVPVNGSFEAGTVGQLPANWTLTSVNSGGVPDSSGWTGNYTVSVVSDNGGKALKLTPANASGTRGYAAMISDAFAVSGGTSYTVTYDRKIENPQDATGTNAGNYGAKVLMYYYDAQMNFLGNDWKDGKKAQQDWSVQTQTVTTLKNTAYMKIGLYIGGSWNGAANFAYYYDNVTVQKTDEIGGGSGDDTGSETQLQFNGDAEQTSDGTLPGWTVTQMNSNSTIANNSSWPFTATGGVGQGVNGSNSLRFTKNRGYGYAAMTSIAVEAAADTYYRLDYMLKFSNASGAGQMLGLRVLVEELDGNGNRLKWNKVDDTGGGIGLDKDLSDGYSSAYTQWQAVATGFKTGADTEKVRLYFWLGGINGANQVTADLDNIVLTALPEKSLINGDLDMVQLGHVTDGRRGENPGQLFWTPETSCPWGYTPRNDGNNFASNYSMEPVNDGTGHETAAKLYVVRSGGGLGASTYYSEPVQVRPGAEYTTTYDLKITGVDNAAATGGAVYMVRFLDESGKTILLGKDSNGFDIHARELNGHPAANQEWTSYSHTFTVPENAHYVQIGMTIGVGTMNTNPNMAYLYDHITLSSVMDPEDLWSVLYGSTVLWAGDEIAMQLAEQSASVSHMKPASTAVSGAGLAAAMENRVVTQLEKVAGKTYDYVLLSGGMADAVAKIPVGAVTAEGVLTGFDAASFAGALEEAFLSVAASYDGQKVAYIFPYQVAGADLTAYHTAAKAACEKWNVPFIDLYSDDDLNDALKPYLNQGILNEQGQIALYQQLTDTLETLKPYDAMSVSGYTVEAALNNRLNGLIGSGVTPAMDALALQELAAMAQKHGLSQIVQKAEEYLQVYDAFRPQMLGATIGDFEPNGLRFMGKNADAENVQITRAGILVIEKAALSGELSLYTEGATAYETENPKAGAVITGTLLGEEADPAVEYAAVAYTVYLVDGTEYAFYSINDHVNQNGDTTAENGMSVRSVWGIAKDMAQKLLFAGNEAIDYAAIGGKQNAHLVADATEKTEVTCLEVFAFVCDNWHLLSPNA